MKPNRPKRVLRIVLLQLVLWPALLLLAEGGYRLYARFQGAPYDFAETVESIVRTSGALADDLPNPGQDAATEKVGSILHPYVGFGPEFMVEAQAREWQRTVDGRNDANEFLILVVGGSVAGGFGDLRSAGVREFGRTLEESAVLEESGLLEGRSVRFLPYGYGGFKQPQQLNLTHYLVSLGIVPDAVVNLDGFNEVALGLTNGLEGINPIYPIYSKWTHRVSDWGGDIAGILERAGAIEEARERAQYWARLADRGLCRSAVLGRFLLARVNRASIDHHRATGAYLKHLDAVGSDANTRGPRHPVEEEPVLATCVRIWEESSRSLHALCEARGIFYFHALQPTLHDEGSKPVTEKERETGRAKESWLTGARTGYPLLRAAGERLQAAGVPFYDASYAFEDTAETLYYDACHFNQQGNAILGRALGAAFAERWVSATHGE